MGKFLIEMKELFEKAIASKKYLLTYDEHGRINEFHSWGEYQIPSQLGAEFIEDLQTIVNDYFKYFANGIMVNAIMENGKLFDNDESGIWDACLINEDGHLMVIGGSECMGSDIKKEFNPLTDFINIDSPNYVTHEFLNNLQLKYRFIMPGKNPKPKDGKCIYFEQ